MRGITTVVSCLWWLLPSVLSQRAALPPAGTEGELTLLGGSAPGTGNVLIAYQGVWGKVCDDGWSLEAAHVVCRQLGHPRALMGTRESHFGEPDAEFVLDDVRCYGSESSLTECEHESWGTHNCRDGEAAGVFCAPRDESVRAHRVAATPATTTTTTTSTTTIATTSETTTRRRRKRPKKPRQKQNRGRNGETNHRADPQVEQQQQQQDDGILERHPSHYPEPYEIRLAQGRTPNEGRLEVNVGGQWGVVCGDEWGLMDAMVACRQAGLGYASSAVQTSFFGGTDLTKLLGGLRCDGEEQMLSGCYHEHVSDVICSSDELVAGVICTLELPDLVPNATLLQESTYLQDRPMYYLQCALEENCAAESAFTVREAVRDWHLHRRRLLRFSSSTWNFGTADFRPNSSKQDWEWHLCHMHYHSMSVFAHYDLLDLNHNRVAQGHKASFCLEDVQCIPEKDKKYQCKGFGDQGISVGCADDYLHDIDCQWIDITDVAPGTYIFKVHVNPEQAVAELDFSNNAVTCELNYSGYDVTVSSCKLGRG